MKKTHVWEARLVRLFARLPLPLVTAFSVLLAHVFCLLPLSVARVRQAVLTNLLIAFPELGWREARRMSGQVIVEMARTFASFSHVWLRPPAEMLGRVTRMHGADAWRRAIADSRPILYLSLHQSCWEVPVLVLGREDPGMLVMYQPGEGDSALEDLVKEGREGTGAVLVPTNGEGVRAALSGMAQGKSMALLADHEPGGRNNPFAPLFGHDVLVPAFVYKVVEQFEPHIFFVSAQRQADGNYEVWFDEIPREHMAAGLQPAMRTMTAMFETIIRRNPAQYHWSYKRFKTGPAGKRKWYRDDSFLRRVQQGESAATVFTDAPGS